MRSISKTITLSTILWVGLILTAGQIIVDNVVSSWLLGQFDTALESKARALVTLTKNDGVEVELDFADEFMPEFDAPSKPEYFELFLGDGSLLERSHSYDRYGDSVFSDQLDDVVFDDWLLPDGRAGRRVSIKFIPQIQDKALRKQTPIEARPWAILRVSRERESLDQVRSEFHMLIIGISLVVLIAVMISITRATNAGLKPLLRIKNEISEISPRAIDRRITTEGQPVELESIATQFNLALSEIEKAFIREREFSSDVAHELRTPVAEIRSLAEVGLRWPDEKDIRSYFADIHGSSKQLDRLIQNLLHLCRSEDGQIELDSQQIQLRDLLETIRNNLANEARDKNITVEIPQAELPEILADRQWMELILHNLIFNAISHSPDGATVRVNLRLNPGGCELEINNPMLDPLSNQDLEMIFKRFWRKDSARESGRHAGIGLALVQNYAELMNLEVKVSISDTLFQIRISNLKITPAS